MLRVASASSTACAVLPKAVCTQPQQHWHALMYAMHCTGLDLPCHLRGPTSYGTHPAALTFGPPPCPLHAPPPCPLPPTGPRPGGPRPRHLPACLAPAAPPRPARGPQQAGAGAAVPCAAPPADLLLQRPRGGALQQGRQCAGGGGGSHPARGPCGGRGAARCVAGGRGAGAVWGGGGRSADPCCVDLCCIAMCCVVEPRGW